jgi:hypothetical protein
MIPATYLDCVFDLNSPSDNNFNQTLRLSAACTTILMLSVGAFDSLGFSNSHHSLARFFVYNILYQKCFRRCHRRILWDFGKEIPHLDRLTQCRIFSFSPLSRPPILYNYEKDAGDTLEDKTLGNHGDGLWGTWKIDFAFHQSAASSTLSHRQNSHSFISLILLVLDHFPRISEDVIHPSRDIISIS